MSESSELAYAELASSLRTIEEQLRDLAYDALRSAASGDADAAAEEKRVLKARRAVERAIQALEPRSSDF
ncbi:MAG: hypothetical protein ACXW1S_03085 [Acidimicrobiia bacterium]